MNQNLSFAAALLREKDPTFGGLRRVLAFTGEYFWVCPRHYKEFDPGLPKIDPRPPQTNGPP